MNNNKIHKLKIEPKYYRDIFDGIKKFELRKNDRNYQVGDFISFIELNYGIEYIHYNLFKIIYVLDSIEAGKYGLCEGYCILGIEKYEIIKKEN